jgi:hypothetical protein
METKNMFKALAMVMLMPAMLLTTACSNDDFAVNDNTEIVNQKGFTIPVTINVTRQGDDATMRATYTDNGNGTGSLGFSSGDKLLVKGRDNGFNQFAGILTWQSGGTFSGTITTENTSYTGTADDLLKNASMVRAILLPAGYDSKGFIKVSGSGYLMDITYDWTKAFALTKAEAVEQLSREYAGSYSSGTGFALAPLGFILNFTITGLTPSTEVAVSFTKGTTTTSGNVTTDGSGNATFAISVNSTSIGSCTLTVGGNNIALPSTSLQAGKIYNITRSAAPAAGHALSSAVVGDVVGSDGQAYDGTDYNNLPTGVTAVAKVCYVSGGHGLALALTDESSSGMDWNTAKTACTNKNTSAPVASASWMLPSKTQWETMGATSSTYTTLRNGFTSVGGSNLESDYYWSSTEYEIAPSNAWMFLFSNGSWDWFPKSINSSLVRACLAF